MSPRAPTVSHRDHRRALQTRLHAGEIAAALIIDRPATHWLTGFRGTASFTLVFPRSAVFITDARYIEAARTELRNLRVVLQRASLEEQLRALLTRHRVKRLGVEGTIPHDQWRWVRRLAPRGVRLVNITPTLTALRAVKTEAEIGALRRAVRLTDAIFADLLPWLRRRLRRGAVTEIEVARWLTREFERRGVEGPSFPPIVAAGPNSARPHAVPGTRRLRAGQFLLFDFGLVRDGYCSDMSRTVIIGKPTTRQRQIYSAVHEAQAAGVAAIRAGVRARDVDAAARDVIRRAGFARHFGHGLGHGVGIEIHEAPRLAQTAKGRLAAGMVVTVEPGIYLPRVGGVRIEDMVVVREDGAEVLTRSPKTLICL